MRVPKRNAGLITKGLKLGIFAKGPKHWAEVHRERRNGVFSRAVQSKGGKFGGAVVGKSNKQLGRGIFAPGAASLGGKEAAAANKTLGRGCFDANVRAKGTKALRSRWADPVWREIQRWKIREAMNRSKARRDRDSGKRIATHTKTRSPNLYV